MGTVRWTSRDAPGRDPLAKGRRGLVPHEDPTMEGSRRRTAWIVAPPEVCCLCKEPLTKPSETSSWNGVPAHRDCVRIHLINRDPAFRESDAQEGPEDPSESVDDILQRDDEDEDSG
jgi:hypothetical protein